MGAQGALVVIGVGDATARLRHDHHRVREVLALVADDGDDLERQEVRLDQPEVDALRPPAPRPSATAIVTIYALGLPAATSIAAGRRATCRRRNIHVD